MDNERRALILNLAVEYYQGALDDRVRKYLRERGLNNESIRGFRLGYAPRRGGLLPYLRDNGVAASEAVEVGLYRRGPGLRRVFRDRLILPFLSGGKVLNLVGRLIPRKGAAETHEPKYLKLLNPKDQSSVPVLFGENTAKRGLPLILTEGPIDAILAAQLDVSAIAAVGLHISKDNLPHLTKLCRRASSAIVVFDTESSGAGTEGARRLGEKLWSLGVRTKIAHLPLPAGRSKLDLAEFIQVKGSHAKDAVAALLGEALPWLEWQIEAIPHQSAREELPRLLRPILSHVAELEGVEREQYIKLISKRFGLTLRAIQEETQLAIREKQASAARDSKVRLTKEQRGTAIDLLKRPSLLFDLGKMADRSGVVGEEKNRLLLYLALTSRLLPDPVSVLVKGQSSSGKSFLAGVVHRLFPPEEVFVWSGMSSKALIYTGRDYRHKGLIFLEWEGSEPAQQSIRYLQSEKKLIYEVTVKNPSTGEFETKEYCHEGPVACVTTTTEASVEIDDENRSFSISPDESPEQTRRILASTLAQRQVRPDRIPPTEAELEVWHNAQRVLAERPVRIIFPKWFSDVSKALPVEDVRIRRDWPRVLAVCEAVALLHHFQRKELQDQNGVPRVVLTLADYEMARIVVEDALRRTLFRLPLNTERVVETVRRLYQKHQRGVTYKEVTQETGLSYGVVYKWTRPAREKGYIAFQEGTMKGNLTRMLPGDVALKGESLLPKAKDILNRRPKLRKCVFVDPITGEKVRLRVHI